MPVFAGPTWTQHFTRRQTPPASTQSTALFNSFEGGTRGATLTLANSGGASGSALNPSAAAANTLAYDNSQAAHGSTSLKIFESAGSSTSVYWNIPDASTTQWFRAYFYLTDYPPSAYQVVVTTAGAAFTTNCRIALGAGGTVQILNAANTFLAQTPGGSYPVNQWFRVEGSITGSATAGACQVQVFSPMDSAVPSATVSVTGANFTGPATRIYFGLFGAYLNLALWLDDIAVVSHTGWIGPSAAASLTAPGYRPIGPAMPGQTWKRRFRPPSQHSTSSPLVTPGPAIPPAARPYRASLPPPSQRGHAWGQAGGPVPPSPLYPLSRPVRAALAAPSARGGTCASPTTALAPPSPLYPLSWPVRASLPPPSARGHAHRRSGPLIAPPSPLYPLGAPVRASLPAPSQRGRIHHRYSPAAPPSPLHPLGGPVQSRFPAPSARGRIHHRFAPAAPASPASPPCAPVRASLPAPSQRGRAQYRSGVAYVPPAPPCPPRGPVRAALPAPPQRGHAHRRPAVLPAVLPAAPASPLYPLRGAVRAVLPVPPQRGRAQYRSGVLYAAPLPPAPPLCPLHGPVRAALPPLARGRIHHRYSPVAPATAALLPGPGLHCPAGAPRPLLPPRGRAYWLSRPLPPPSRLYPLHAPVQARSPAPPVRGRAYRVRPALPYAAPALLCPMYLRRPRTRLNARLLPSRRRWASPGWGQASRGSAWPTAPRIAGPRPRWHPRLLLSRHRYLATRIFPVAQLSNEVSFGWNVLSDVNAVITIQWRVGASIQTYPRLMSGNDPGFQQNATRLISDDGMGFLTGGGE